MNQAKELDRLRHVLIDVYYSNTRLKNGPWWCHPEISVTLTGTDTHVRLVTTGDDVHVPLGEEVIYTRQDLEHYEDMKTKVKEHCELAYKLHQLL
jgi:hypothetical protein